MLFLLEWAVALVLVGVDAVHKDRLHCQLDDRAILDHQDIVDLYSYGIYCYGLYSYGLYSYGLYTDGRRRGPGPVG